MSKVANPTDHYYGSTDLYDLGALIPVSDEPTIYTGKPIVSASILPRALAAALINPSANAVFMLGHVQTSSTDATVIPYLVVRDLEKFYHSLHRASSGQIGGYVHQVDPSHFQRLADPIGQLKWMSLEPVRVIEKPRFVSVESSMQSGVQIYYVRDESCVAKIVKERRNPADVIPGAVNDRSMGWLNQDRGINPVPFPAPQPPAYSPYLTSALILPKI